MREITHRYRDPLDALWIEAATLIGLRVDRTGAAYATTDGRGRLLIGEDADLDADDCLAQMIFHELCHSLVEGAESFEAADWGLDNESDQHLRREYACLRLQATLASPYGLRWLLAPTTEHRAFYDRLGPDPLARPDDESIRLARAGAARATRPPWAPHLTHALTATRKIALAVAPASGGSPKSEPRSLFSLLEPEVPPHPTGLEGRLDAASDGARCGTCAFRVVKGPGKKVPRCLQAGGARVDDAAPACARYEAELDCLSCGACCREAYGAVEVGKREPFVREHAELVEERDGRLQILRDSDRCAALEGGRTIDEPYRCRVYDARPRTCRDFTLGSAHCLTARRRVGLSR